MSIFIKYIAVSALTGDAWLWYMGDHKNPDYFEIIFGSILGLLWPVTGVGYKK